MRHLGAIFTGSMSQGLIAKPKVFGTRDGPRLFLNRFAFSFLAQPMMGIGLESFF
jgi:hypothetical protein